MRMGGDEFVVVLQASSAPRSSARWPAHQRGLNTPIVIDGHPLQTTGSIGVSLFPRDGADMGELLRHSDTAMYQAKDRGRNNFQMFSPIMARKLAARRHRGLPARGAERGQLDVHYQPFVESQPSASWVSRR